MEQIRSVQLSLHEPNYYAQIPSVIYHCTYVIEENGQKVRKKLSTYAIALYGMLKALGGKSGAVWKNSRDLAELCSMSKSQVSNVKKELLQPMEQLGGKNLIRIEERRIKHQIDSGSTGSTIGHIIHINHIWPENNEYMSNLDRQPTLEIGIVHNFEDKGGSGLPNKLDGGSGLHNKTALLGASLPYGHISDNQSNTIDNHQIPFEPLPPPSVHKGVSGTADSADYKKRTTDFSDDRKKTPAQNKSCRTLMDIITGKGIKGDDKETFHDGIIEAMRKFVGFEERFIQEMLKKYDTRTLHKAGLRLEEALKNSKFPIKNKQAYFRTILAKGV